MEISNFPCRDLKNILRRKASRYNGSLPKIFGPVTSSFQSFIWTEQREKSVLKSRCRTANRGRRLPSDIYMEIDASTDIIVGSHNLDTITSEWRVRTGNVLNAILNRDIQEFLSQMISECLDQYIGSPNSFSTRQHIVGILQNQLNTLAALEIIGPNPSVTVESIDSETHIDLIITIHLTNGQTLNLNSSVNL